MAAATPDDKSTNKTHAKSGSANQNVAEAADEVDEAVGALDFLLPDATVGIMRRFWPDATLARWAIKLASQPAVVAGQAAKLSADLATSRQAARKSPRSAGTAGSQIRRGCRTCCSSARCRRTWPSAGPLDTLLADASLDWRDNTRLKFVLMNLIAASAPSNNPFLSPDVWKAAIDTGGMSLVRGLRAFVTDMSSTPHIPTMVKPDVFTVGKDIAVTPGSVVARTDVFELIQYKPSTPTVHEFPLLMIPPMINKYYITDLTPGRSMLEFFVAQGYQVFGALAEPRPGGEELGCEHLR